LHVLWPLQDWSYIYKKDLHDEKADIGRPVAIVDLSRCELEGSTQTFKKARLHRGELIETLEERVPVEIRSTPF
jgi:hypothetical protein